MGPLHHQVAATMVPLLAARPIASTADFRRFGHPQTLPINHLLCENRRTQGRMGEVGLTIALAYASSLRRRCCAAEQRAPLMQSNDRSTARREGEGEDQG